MVLRFCMFFEKYMSRMEERGARTIFRGLVAASASDEIRLAGVRQSNSSQPDVPSESSFWRDEMAADFVRIRSAARFAV